MILAYICLIFSHLIFDNKSMSTSPHDYMWPCHERRLDSDVTQERFEHNPELVKADRLADLPPTEFWNSSPVFNEVDLNPEGPFPDLRDPIYHHIDTSLGVRSSEHTNYYYSPHGSAWKIPSSGADLATDRENESHSPVDDSQLFRNLGLPWADPFPGAHPTTYSESSFPVHDSQVVYPGDVNNPLAQHTSPTFDQKGTSSAIPSLFHPVGESNYDDKLQQGLEGTHGRINPSFRRGTPDQDRSQRQQFSDLLELMLMNNRVRDQHSQNLADDKVPEQSEKSLHQRPEIPDEGDQYQQTPLTFQPIEDNTYKPASGNRDFGSESSNVVHMGVHHKQFLSPKKWRTTAENRKASMKRFMEKRFGRLQTKNSRVDSNNPCIVLD